MQTLDKSVRIPINHRRPLPLRTRVSYPRAMTIALGILANDGFVLAADTQVTVPNYLKTSQGKATFACRAVPPPDASGMVSIAISGSGSESSIDHVREGITKSFLESKTVMSATEIRADLEHRILDLHKKHITPHGGGTLDVDMIVATLSDTEKKLWTTDKSIVNEHSVFAAVGAGAMYARILMNRLYAPMDTIGAILLASYVISEVKQIDGCGDKTDLIGISTRKLFWPSRAMSLRLEEIFKQYSAVVTSVLHESLCGHIGWPVPSIQSSPEIKNLCTEMEKVIQSLQEFSQPNNASSPDTSQT